MSTMSTAITMHPMPPINANTFTPPAASNRKHEREKKNLKTQSNDNLRSSIESESKRFHNNWKYFAERRNGRRHTVCQQNVFRHAGHIVAFIVCEFNTHFQCVVVQTGNWCASLSFGQIANRINVPVQLWSRDTGDGKCEIEWNDETHTKKKNKKRNRTKSEKQQREKTQQAEPEAYGLINENQWCRSIILADVKRMVDEVCSCSTIFQMAFCSIFNGQTGGTTKKSRTKIYVVDTNTKAKHWRFSTLAVLLIDEPQQNEKSYQKHMAICLP